MWNGRRHCRDGGRKGFRTFEGAHTPGDGTPDAGALRARFGGRIYPQQCRYRGCSFGYRQTGGRLGAIYLGDVIAMLKSILMPTWGLSMEEGTVTKWLVSEGADILPGADLLEIETTKIANVLEATETGVLRRIVVQPGQTRACGDLLGVLVDGEASEAEIDAFVVHFIRSESAIGADAGLQMPEPIVIDLPSGPIRYLQQGDTGSVTILIHG